MKSNGKRSSSTEVAARDAAAGARRHIRKTCTSNEGQQHQVPVPACPVVRTLKSIVPKSKPRRGAKSVQRTSGCHRGNGGIAGRRGRVEKTKSWLRALQGTALPSNAECSLPIPEVITVGSDCTGLGTELLAAELCGIRCKPVFGSELSPDVRRLHKLLHPTAPPLDVDCTKRDVMSTPEVDLYVAGPPCQPWSAMGQQRGLNDIRGTVFYHVLNFVRQRRPRVALIENVRGLIDRHPCELFDVVQIIKESGYCVTWDIVNTEHHGIPQSRPRLFIVAIRADSCAHTFKFPKKLKVLPSVDLFLKHGKPHHGEPQLEPLRLLPDNGTAHRNMSLATTSLAAKGIDPAKVSTFVDVFASKKFANCKAGVCPCITASRSKAGGFYVTTLKRMTYYQELGGLQGFPMKKLRKLLTCHHVKQNTIGHAIGNAISVNVLMRLLPRILVAAGLVQPTVAARSDLWKRLTKTQLRSMNTLPDDLYHTRRDVSQ